MFPTHAEPSGRGQQRNCDQGQHHPHVGLPRSLRTEDSARTLRHYGRGDFVVALAGLAGHPLKLPPDGVADPEVAPASPTTFTPSLVGRRTRDRTRRRPPSLLPPDPQIPPHPSDRLL